MKISMKIGMTGVLIAGLLAGSCDSYFDVPTDDMLEASDSYQERETVYAGLIGLATVFREVTEHHVVLSELLGDLMQPTTNAPDACWDVYRFKAGNGNEFASPRPYYTLVVNCNDFLRNVIAYNRNYPGTLGDNVYRGLISTALTYRAWAYLQLGKLFGEAVYYDISFVDNNGTFPQRVLKLDELVEELIYNLKNGVEGVNAFQTLDWKTVIAPMEDNFDQMWNHVSIDANVLLTELYLWARDYTNAVKTGLNFLSAAGDNYKLTVWRGDNKDRQWFKMFTGNFGGDHLKEICTLAPFDFERGQTGKLQYYFSNESPNVYYFQPHMNQLRRFSSQASRMSAPSEPDEKPTLLRTTDEQRLAGSVKYKNGQYTIAKYSHERKNYEQDAPVYIYRAPELYLMVAEALSGLGGSNNIAAADSIINVGFQSSWVNGHFEQPFEAPIYTSVFNKCPGVRRRVVIGGDYIRYHVDTLAFPDKTEEQKLLRQQREKFVLDSLICEETALELAYEGKRWFTLLRIARNTGRPELLAKQVAAKFDAGESQVYERWLMDPQNWFIKWDQQAVKKGEN